LLGLVLLISKTGTLLFSKTEAPELIMSINIVDSKGNLNNEVLQDFEQVIGVQWPNE